MSEIDKASILLSYQLPLSMAATNPNHVVIAGGTASIPSGGQFSAESSQISVPQHKGVGVDLTRPPESRRPNGHGLHIVSADQETKECCKCCCACEQEEDLMFASPGVYTEDNGDWTVEGPWLTAITWIRDDLLAPSKLGDPMNVLEYQGLFDIYRESHGVYPDVPMQVMLVKQWRDVLDFAKARDKQPSDPDERSPLNLMWDLERPYLAYTRVQPILIVRNGVVVDIQSTVEMHVGYLGGPMPFVDAIKPADYHTTKGGWILPAFPLCGYMEYFAGFRPRCFETPSMTSGSRSLNDFLGPNFTPPIYQHKIVVLLCADGGYQVSLRGSEWPVHGLWVDDVKVFESIPSKLFDGLYVNKRHPWLNSGLLGSYSGKVPIKGRRW